MATFDERGVSGSTAMTTSLRVAFAFLTRLPVARAEPLTADDACRAPRPGFRSSASRSARRWARIRALADIGLEPVPATVLALLGAVLLTGALHEDGLADCADAVGAHASRERRPEILHDPRVGTFGALALVFAIHVRSGVARTTRHIALPPSRQSPPS